MGRAGRIDPDVAGGLRRLVAISLALAAAIYVAAAAYLYFQQRSLLYFPTPPAKLDAQRIEFSSGGLTLRGWALNPGRPAAVLYFGGNGEAVERNADFFLGLLPGHTVYLLPYRGYAGNPGSPSERDLYADALRAFDALASRHEWVAVMGRSLGTGVATYVAAHRPVERLVLVTPYDSIENLAQAKYAWLPVGLLLQDKYESWRRAPELRMATLMLVAEQDRIVPRANTERLIASFRRSPSVVMIAGAGHNDISSRREYSQALEVFLADGRRVGDATP
jgi:hypothetical protein